MTSRSSLFWGPHELALLGDGDYMNGVGGDAGYCVATDISGDQYIDIFNDDNHAPDAKSFGGTDKWSGGTGKYAGSGSDLTV